jgi:cytochrome P450
LELTSPGADTTGASIIYMLHTLALPENKVYQDRLRAELLKLPYPYNFKDVCNLPFLESCSREILRIRSPGPGNIQQRCTPPSTTTSITVGDCVYKLPGDTLIGTQAFSLHRNEDVYGKDVNKFLPERWETENEAQLRAMKDAWIPFGHGARVCVGMKLVYPSPVNLLCIHAGLPSIKASPLWS